jgi:rhodanese-related sulfurtransferase
MTGSRLRETLGWLLLAAFIVGLVLIGELFDSRVTDDVPAVLEDITAAEAYEMIQANAGNPDFVIIDVRTDDEFAGGHIQNAVHINFYADSFSPDIKALERDDTYLVYCQSGGRSGQTLGLMAVLDFREVYDLIGGVNAWQEAGLPLVD